MNLRILAALIIATLLIPTGHFVFQFLQSNSLEVTISSNHQGLENIKIENPEAWQILGKNSGIANSQTLNINDKIINTDSKIKKISINLVDEEQPHYAFMNNEKNIIVASAYAEVKGDELKIKFYVHEDFIADSNLEYFLHELIWLIAGTQDGEREADFKLRVQNSREYFRNKNLQLVIGR